MNKELYDKGQVLLDAAYDYWKECLKQKQYGAIQWLDDHNGNTVIFTRGEYRGQLLHNIDALRSEAMLNTSHMPPPEDENPKKDIHQ